MRDLFTALPSSYDSVSLYDALGLNGGGVAALLRHAVSAVLQPRIHAEVAYPLSAGEVIALVNAAVTGGDRPRDRSTQNLLAGYNELGSDLDPTGTHRCHVHRAARRVGDGYVEHLGVADFDDIDDIDDVTNRGAGRDVHARSILVDVLGRHLGSDRQSDGSGPVAALTAVVGGRWCGPGGATRRPLRDHCHWHSPALAEPSQPRHPAHPPRSAGPPPPWWKAARGAAPGART